MDSLLDTMTNVVGILVIMLVVTQLGVQDAVKRITGYITQEELEESRDAAQDLEHLLALEIERKRALEEKEPEARLTIEQQKALIAEYEKRIAEIRDARLDPEKLAADLESLRKEEAELAGEIDARMAEIASLKARLAETPAGPDPDAKIVNLPNPRPAPEKAEAVEFIARNGKLYEIENLDELQQRAMEEINTAKRKLDLQLDPEDPERLRIDGDKLKAHFDEKFVGDRTFRIKIAIAGGTPQIVLEPRETAGLETRRVESGFGRLITKYRNQPRFLRFRVFADSFETYLAARNVADRVGIPAGWVPYDANAEYRVGLGNKTPILVAGYTPPPPRPPTPPDPNRPPPPPKSDVD